MLNAANAVSPVDRKPRKPELMLSRFSVASCPPVMACTPAGSTGRSRAASSASGTPGAARTRIWLSWARPWDPLGPVRCRRAADRKSTRLNSSHVEISYAVSCLKKNYPVAQDQKADLLRELLERVNYDSVIVFCRTKNRADRLGNLLRKNNHAVTILHSNRTQREREQALRGFRDGRFEVLVATDIAARGLDIANVSHVINFDVPQHPEDYVHRIGRTGRAEAA